MNFNEKVVLITGASSGIGAETALYLSRLGAKLSLTGRNETKLFQTVQDCKTASNGSEPFYILGDMSKEEDVENILKETVKRYGCLDVLVNNAGISILGNLESQKLEDYDRVMNVNMRSVYILTKLAMPYLIKTRGNVVNVSSVAGFRPAVGNISYNISKAALDQFTKCVALEVAPKKVRVNSVNPGVIKTDNKTNEKERYARMAELHPIGRVGEPEEVAAAIAFLASDQASNITGVNFPVDGGICIARNALK